jgi:hypothetical protein
MPIGTAAAISTRNRTGRHSCRSCSIGSAATGCTYSTNPRPRYRQPAGSAGRHASTGSAQFAVHHRDPFPILLGYPGATIYLFGEKKLARIAYPDTEHCQITKAFLDRPERMLNELFRADDAPDA